MPSKHLPWVRFPVGARQYNILLTFLPAIQKYFPFVIESGVSLCIICILYLKLLAFSSILLIEGSAASRVQQCTQVLCLYSWLFNCTLIPNVCLCDEVGVIHTYIHTYMCVVRWSIGVQKLRVLCTLPVPGLEPGYPAWKASMLATYIIPDRGILVPTTTSTILIPYHIQKLTTLSTFIQ